MAICPASCDPIILLQNPEQCQIQGRYNTISRFGFYPCNITLPEPLTAEAIEDLIADGTIVFSNEISAFTANDPTFDEQALSICRPSFRKVASRELTFEESIAVTATQGSPAVPNPYFDYAFWDDKQTKSLSLNYLIQYCNGDTVIALDENGNPLSADLQVWLNWAASTTQGSLAREFKAGSIIFNGDPLALRNAPAFNVSPNGVVTLL